MTRAISIVLTCALIQAGLRAQSLSFPNPVTPGAAVPIVVTNDTGLPMVYGIGNDIAALLRATGERVAPDVFHQGDVLGTVPPGGTTSGTLVIPSSGNGSQGSFLVYSPMSWGAVRRIDIGSPSETFPAIHAFPQGVHRGHGSHDGYGHFQKTWMLANSSSVQHTFGSGDRIDGERIDVLIAGTNTVVATRPLAGITVAPGKVTFVPLPLASLTPGPYTVQVTWDDPIAGRSVQRDGITNDTGHVIDMHFASGKRIPMGSRLDVDVFFSRFSDAPYFAFLVGLEPGSITLPGGVILPLAGDSFVLQSFSALGGLLSKSQGIPAQFHPCFCPGWFGARWNIELAHPGPVASGLVLHAATLALDPSTGLFSASQPEDFLLQ